MNTLILNRATGKLPDDGWYQIEVPGTHVNHDAKVVQVIDARAVDAIVNRFAADAAKPNFAGILIDQDHFSLDAEKSSEAMGWVMEMRNRAGIPEARIDWSSTGRTKVEGKDYKFFSTVYQPDDVDVLGTQTVAKKTYQKVRPLHLSRLALTNDPNNKGGKPISNRGGNPAETAENNETSPMKSLLKKLGLAEDASEESAVAALQTIQNRATTAEGSVSTLTKERDELLAAQVEADLDKHADVIANREDFKKQLIANRAGTLAVLAGLKKPEAKKAPATITNRGTAKAPEATGEGQSLYAKRDAAVQSYAIKNRCDFHSAWNAVRSEQPDLFVEEAK